MKIESYEFAPAQIDAEFETGGFNKRTGKVKAFTKFAYVHEVLDVLAAAAEAGALNKKKWVSQLFADKAVFDELLENLTGYDECFRIHDRWYQALFRLTDLCDEEGFVTSQEIAETLREVAEETNQI